MMTPKSYYDLTLGLDLILNCQFFREKKPKHISTVNDVFIHISIHLFIANGKKEAKKKVSMSKSSESVLTSFRPLGGTCALHQSTPPDED